MSPTNEYQDPAYAQAYLSQADDIPHRHEGEKVLLELLPAQMGRILDLGTGDGRLIAIIQSSKNVRHAIGTDYSRPMLQHAQQRFKDDASITLHEHNLNDALPGWLAFDAIVSCFAIHHVSHTRKQSLFEEIFTHLKPGGIFCNLEHVSSPTKKLEADFYLALGTTAENADPSNICADVASQLKWMRNAGFIDVDCFWKWRELALLAGTKPSTSKTT